MQFRKLELNFVPFGRLRIDIPKLMKGEVSLINRHNTGPKLDLAGYVSPNLKQVFIDLINKKTPDLSSLTITERLYLNNVLKKSYFEHNIPIASIKENKLGQGIHSDTKTHELQNKLDILLGEIAAGNNSRELFNMMTELLDHMVNLKLIEPKKAQKMLEDARYENVHDGKNKEEVSKET